ncbi:H-NS histone family protein [Rugamonas sp. A1-17]|nr:H-NS histone family protein [Rugamonas sp. A1-17]
MNLTEMSKNDLVELSKAISAQLAVHKAKAIVDVKTIMEQYGMTLSDIYPAAERKLSKAPRYTAVRYVHPTDSTQTWTGLGRRPKWVNAYIAMDKPLSDLEIRV